ncbi:shikimate dehydrogenase [Synechococcus sp. CCAP 1479/10]|uniref:shikimate dehydrogenase n=1 Tax=Synechococcus sp. CCAP 1479/10 TaxID=1221594 RepID=UPI001C24E6B3|nr:shikimate dehydrogenase [Synechococcus sp. CCAP 1479/10]
MPDSLPTASVLAPLKEKGLMLGLIGAGIQASRTPALHMAEAASQGFPCVYRIIDLDRIPGGAATLPELLVAAERMGFAGLNITFPCKQQVIPLLDELSPEAAALGAVNTVVLRDGRRIGHNTDCSGFGESFRRGLPGVARGRVVQLGAGGAGSAVAQALLDAGVQRLAVHDVDAARAGELAASLAARFGDGRAVPVADLAEEVAQADGLVNCTPVGMAKLPGMALPPAMLHGGLWVAEIVYFPLETALLAAARALGCRTLDGGGMAVFQAAHAFTHFTGLVPDAERMLAGFRAALRGG